MNECPTRVRTGRRRARRTISGTAREVIRLWITVEPGCRASSRTATSAVTADGDTGSPCSSMTKQRSASPSKASPMSAPVLAHPGLQVDQVGRVERVRLVVGERAVELEVHRHQVDRQPGQDGRHGVPGHPVAGVDDDLQPARAGQVDEVAQVLGVRRRGRRAGTPARRRTPLSGSGTPCWARSRISVRPLSWPIGRGAGAAELDAVVAGRVVAGREHRAGQVEAAAGEVELVGRGEADRRRRRRPARSRPRRTPRRAPARTVACRDRRRCRRQPAPATRDEGGAQRPHHLGVELVGDGAADVVRLDERGEVLA